MLKCIECFWGDVRRRSFCREPRGGDRNPTVEPRGLLRHVGHRAQQDLLRTRRTRWIIVPRWDVQITTYSLTPWLTVWFVLFCIHVTAFTEWGSTWFNEDRSEFYIMLVTSCDILWHLVTFCDLCAGLRSGSTRVMLRGNCLQSISQRRTVSLRLATDSPCFAMLCPSGAMQRVTKWQHAYAGKNFIVN
jgi:hypothetical protein